MWDIGAIRAALYRAAEERAQMVSDELAEKGKIQEKVSVKDNKKTYEINIPSIKLTTLFNIKAHYVQRNDFLKAFAPLVGAVIKEKFHDEYEKNNEEDSLTKRWPLGINLAFRQFCDENVIPAGDRGFSDVGCTWVSFGGGGSGASHGFKVPFRHSDLYEETITSPKEKRALFEFAKSYIQAMHKYGPYAEYNNKDYMDIRCDDAHLKTAYKALARISSTLQDKRFEDLSKEEKLWHTASQLISLNTDEPEQQENEKQAPSLWQKLQNALKL